MDPERVQCGEQPLKDGGCTVAGTMEGEEKARGNQGGGAGYLRGERKPRKEVRTLGGYTLSGSRNVGKLRTPR